MMNERERVISITLSEAEWQAFTARQPQPVSWLRERIREEVVKPDEPLGPNASSASSRLTAA